jgi:hypothetical protein
LIDPVVPPPFQPSPFSSSIEKQLGSRSSTAIDGPFVCRARYCMISENETFPMPGIIAISAGIIDNKQFGTLIPQASSAVTVRSLSPAPLNGIRSDLSDIRILSLFEARMALTAIIN